MSLRTILHYPDNRLRQVCPEHTEYDESLKLLVSDMFETMYHEKGIGLSAIQINVITRVITIDVSKERNEQLVLINPIITEKKDLIFLMKDACLFLGFNEKVERYNYITLEANDVNGKKFSLDASELLAVCIQHEIDHLDGKLFVDYLSDMKRSKIEKGLLKQNNKSALHRKENPYLK